MLKADKLTSSQNTADGVQPLLIIPTGPESEPTGDACLSASTVVEDAGWQDEYRGWFDIQGCGKCNDYCRWVEGTQSGGDPAVKTNDAALGSYWSCRLAGGDDAYTAKGTYSSWEYNKCDAQGSSTSNATSLDAAFNFEEFALGEGRQ